MFSRNLKFASLLIVAVVAVNVVGIELKGHHGATHIPTSTLMPPTYRPVLKEEVVLAFRNLVRVLKEVLPEPIVVAIKHIWQDLRTIKEALPLPVCTCLKLIDENLKLLLPKLLSFVEVSTKREQPIQEFMQTLLEQLVLLLRQMIPFVEEINTRILSTN
uniref:Uncharacterized protein n=1 Tax=Glossina morsitans morsitans TaxID=37546 RepID=A0A905ATF9_GLOMM